MEKLKSSSVIKPWQAETPVLRSIERVLGLFNFDSYPRIQRAAFVDIYQKQETQQCLDALLQNPALPVVLMDIGGGKVLNHALEVSSNLTQIVRFPNVRMIDSLKLVADLPTLYEQPRFSFTQEQFIKVSERVRSYIKHDLGHALRGNADFNKDKLLHRARRELGLTGSDDEIMQIVMSETVTIQPSKYMFVNAVGVDWDGTIFQDGILQQDCLTQIQSEAAQKNLPVMIWTGGDVNGVYRVLKQNGISDLDVAAKQDCLGLEIVRAFDDEEKTALEKTYGVKIGEIKKIV